MEQGMEQMEQQKGSVLDSFLDQFRTPSGVAMTEAAGIERNISEIRSGAQAEGAAFHPQGEGANKADPAGSTARSGGEPMSAHQEQQIEFCNLLWEGISEKVMKAVAGNGPADHANDLALRKKIFEQLQNPQVNFREFSRLVYRWRDLHLNGMLPPKAAVDIPSWETKPFREGGEEGAMNRDGPGQKKEAERNGTA